MEIIGHVDSGKGNLTKELMNSLNDVKISDDLPNPKDLSIINSNDVILNNPKKDKKGAFYGKHIRRTRTTVYNRKGRK